MSDKNEDSKQSSLANFDNSNAKASLEKIKEIKNFHSFASKQLSDEFVRKNFNLLWHFYLDKKKCEQSGDVNCTNSQGIHYDFDVVDNDKMFTRTYVCSKVQKKNNATRFKDYYLVCHFNKELYSKLRLSNNYINFSHHKSRLTLIQYLRGIIDGKLNHGIYLYGESGVGKTYILIAACNELARQRKTIAYVYVPRLIQEIRICPRASDVNNRYDLVQNLKNVDFLVLDEFGSESPTDARWFYSSFISPILNFRRDYGMLTTFISNYSISDLKRKLTAKIYYSRNLIMDDTSADYIISRIQALVSHTTVCLLGKKLI